MITVRQMRGAQRGRELSFDAARVRIGRLEDNDLCFDPVEDLDVSGRHAEIHQAGGGCLLVDVGSLNGTWVNDKRIEQVVLKTGDEIDFGQTGPRLLVTFVSENPELQKQSFSDDTTGQGRSMRATDPQPQPSFAYLPTLDGITNGDPQRARIPTLPPIQSATPSWKSVLLWSFGMLGVLTVIAYAVTNWHSRSDSNHLNVPLQVLQKLETAPEQSVEIWCGNAANPDVKICSGVPVSSSSIAVSAACVAQIAQNAALPCWVRSADGESTSRAYVQPTMGLLRLSESNPRNMAAPAP